MRNVIPFTQALKDLLVTCNAIATTPEVTCEVFGDNQSCIVVAISKKPLARTNNIAIKFHHFRSLVDKIVIKLNVLAPGSN